MKYGLYNAGPLFTEGEMAQRKKEGVELRQKLSKNFIIYNPADYDFNDADSIRTNKIIFDYDNSTIQKSNFAIVDLDTSDPGTIMEFGMFVQRALYDDNVYIIVKLTDFRNTMKINHGEIPGYALNGFVSGVFLNEKLLTNKLLPQIYIVNSSADAIETANAIDDVLQNKTLVDGEQFHKQHSQGWYVWTDKNKFPK